MNLSLIDPIHSLLVLLENRKSIRTATNRSDSRQIDPNHHKSKIGPNRNPQQINPKSYTPHPRHSTRICTYLPMPPPPPPYIDADADPPMQ
jgi:hypothetical protein